MVSVLCVQCPAVVSVGSRPPRCSVCDSPTKRLSDIASLEQSCDIFTGTLVDLLWPVCQHMLHQIKVALAAMRQYLI